jgi:hypothetical protein
VKNHPSVPKPRLKITLIVIILVIVIGRLCFTIVVPSVQR